MLTRAQKSLIKRAQREAQLPDDEYREALAAVCGYRSSKDPRMTNRDADLALAYMEAIFWRRVEKGELQPPCKPNAVFRQRGFWAGRNTKAETSRDRYTARSLADQVAAVEGEMAQLGFGHDYCEAIRENVAQGYWDTRAQRAYIAALRRTLRSKQNNNLPVCDSAVI